MRGVGAADVVSLAAKARAAEAAALAAQPAALHPSVPLLSVPMPCAASLRHSPTYTSPLLYASSPRPSWHFLG